MEFSRELRNDVLAGDITLSVRLWKQARVKRGGRYRVGLGEIEVDAIELVPAAWAGHTAVQRPQVKQGGRYRVGLGAIEVDTIELVPFAAIPGKDVRRAGEPDRETLRQRAAHAGPIDEDTLVYRIEFHPVSPDD